MSEYVEMSKPKHIATYAIYGPVSGKRVSRHSAQRWGRMAEWFKAAVLKTLINLAFWLFPKHKGLIMAIAYTWVTPAQTAPDTPVKRFDDAPPHGTTKEER